MSAIHTVGCGNRLQQGQHGSSAGSGGSLRTPVAKREPRKDAVDRRFRSDEPAPLHERIPDLFFGGWLGGLWRAGRQPPALLRAKDPRLTRSEAAQEVDYIYTRRRDATPF